MVGGSSSKLYNKHNLQSFVHFYQDSFAGNNVYV